MTAPSTRRSPRASGVLAAAIALGVIAVEVGIVAAWVVFVLHDEGWSRTVWVVVGLLVGWRLLPHPARLSGRAAPLTRTDFPAVHRLVDAVAGRVGGRRPARIAVDTTYPVAAYATGYLGHSTLVIGLPQWTASDPEERVAALAHELACVRPKAGPTGCLVRLADDLLTSARSILTPVQVVRADDTAITQSTAGYGEIGPAGDLVANRLAREASAAVGAAGMSVVAAPIRLVQRALHRAWCPVLVGAALAADVAAATLVGPESVLSMVGSTVGVPRGLTAARNAARAHRGEDAFLALDAALRPDPQETEQRLAAAADTRLDGWHPRTAERVAAVRGSGGAAPDPLDADLAAAADAELVALRSRFLARLSEELVHGRP